MDREDMILDHYTYSEMLHDAGLRVPDVSVDEHAIHLIRL